MDPGEVLLLRPSGEETEVVAGSSIKVLAAAARAKLGLGTIVTGLTRPERVNQLAFEWSKGARP